jgi:hypothetical protein
MVVVPCKSLLKHGRMEIVVVDLMIPASTTQAKMMVRFVTGNNKGCYVDCALKQFLAAAREQDDEFTSLPLAGIGNNLCIRADVPNSKAGIGQYVRHDVKFNKINDKLRIRTSQGLGRLKRGRSKFLVYLDIN